jgi:diguanylate cyclase
VETPEQLARLRELGCASVQGFGICRPLPSAALSEWLRSRPSLPSPIPAPTRMPTPTPKS